MKRKTSKNGINFIAEREGEVLEGYYDSAGKLTVGVGHLVKPGEPYRYRVPITKAESRRLLAEDLAIAEDVVNNLVKVPLTQNQFDALVSFVFNIGERNFRRSSVLRALNSGDYEGAARYFMLFTKIRGKDGRLKVSHGLKIRRKMEMDLFNTPDDISEKKDTPPPVDVTKSEVVTGIYSSDGGWYQGKTTTYSVSDIPDKLNTVTNFADNITRVVSSTNAAKAAVSKSSLLAFIFNTVVGSISFIYGVLGDNPWIFIVGAVVTIAALIYLHYSKERATDRLIESMSVDNK